MYSTINTSPDKIIRNYCAKLCLILFKINIYTVLAVLMKYANPCKMAALQNFYYLPYISFARNTLYFRG